MRSVMIIDEGNDTMKLKSLKIDGIGGIKNSLEINFSDRFNVICGANGIGKSTILNAIGDAFSGQAMVKKNALCNLGHYCLTIETEKGLETVEKRVTDFEPDKKNFSMSRPDVKDILLFRVGRKIPYRQMNSISRDPGRIQNDNNRIAAFGVNEKEIKNWFDNRYCFIDKEGSLTENQKKNFSLATEAFGLLDKNVSFKKVIPSTLDIIVNTNRGEIYFEYLSSGYQSCLYIILGMIKELEYRNKDAYIDVKNFNGCVLIDEIDEHLHPSWQVSLVTSLRQLFPYAQFIVTTHSPNILQTLGQKEIIPLVEDEYGNVYVKELNLGKYGLQGWSLEEILEDVMGLNSTCSPVYENAIAKFDKTLCEEDYEKAREYYQILDKMLHPHSVRRKLLQIQMVGIGDRND